MTMIKTTIAEYLLKRIKELGINSIFGVPGDFNLKLLDYIEDDPDLTWSGQANELNASYAADGYARINGAGCVTTVYGVGDLSVSCGMAGSFAERVPVIYLVGLPSTKAQINRALVHHSLGDGDFSIFSKMIAPLNCARAQLSCTAAAHQIDHVLCESMRLRQPGYICFNVDVIEQMIDVHDAPLELQPVQNPVDSQEAALRAILGLVATAKRPIVIADACAARFHMREALQKFLDVSGFPVYVTPMGKGVIEATHTSFRGCYSGQPSLPGIVQEVDAADLVIQVGGLGADANTGAFSGVFEKNRVVALHSAATHVQHSIYEHVGMHSLLPLLTRHFPPSARLSPKELEARLGPRPMRPLVKPGKKLTQDYFWQAIGQYLPPRAVVVVETGTAFLASANLDGPSEATFISQYLWAAVGYTLPAAMGAALADQTRRVFSIIGDGSFQLTAQAIASMLHHGLCPVLIVLNNDGYLIEKMIHGPTRQYNDIPMWQYANSLDYFGAGLQCNARRAVRRPLLGVQKKITTRDQFHRAMAQTTEQPDRIHLLELIMPHDDAPLEAIANIEMARTLQN
ncbi:thiamine diphosphate-binding protein [Gongronella butleri]|nr:thiamine diphosphate-binding protein [Gongronella butleri]